MALEPRKVERIVGFFIVVLLVLSVFAVVLFLKQRDIFTKKFELVAVFEKGAAIGEGTVVKMEGLPIGRVRKLRFNAQNQLEGILSVNVAYRRQIRKDSIATVVRTNLLANPEVDISVGSLDAPLLMQGETIPATMTMEPSMRDFMNLANNVVVVVRDLRDPKGSFQRIMRNMEEISTKLNQGTGSVSTMLKDDGQVYQDSREILAQFNGIIKGQSSVPITLTPESQLMVSLSEKLDRQTDVFTELAKKFDRVADKLSEKDNMAGALLNDPEFYGEMRQFLRDSRVFLMDIQQLAVELRAVVPELPGLIEEGKADLKEMGKVLRSVQRLPFMGGGAEPTPKPQILNVPARLGVIEDKK